MMHITSLVYYLQHTDTLTVLTHYSTPLLLYIHLRFLFFYKHYHTDILYKIHFICGFEPCVYCSVLCHVKCSFFWLEYLCFSAHLCTQSHCTCFLFLLHFTYVLSALCISYKHESCTIGSSYVISLCTIAVIMIKISIWYPYFPFFFDTVTSGLLLLLFFLFQYFIFSVLLTEA